MIRNRAADGNQNLSKDLPFPTPNLDQATLKSVLHQVGSALSQLSSSVLVNSLEKFHFLSLKHKRSSSSPLSCCQSLLLGL